MSSKDFNRSVVYRIKNDGDWRRDKDKNGGFWLNWSEPDFRWRELSLSWRSLGFVGKDLLLIVKLVGSGKLSFGFLWVGQLCQVSWISLCHISEHAHAHAHAHARTHTHINPWYCNCNFIMLLHNFFLSGYVISYWSLNLISPTFLHCENVWLVD